LNGWGNLARFLPEKCLLNKDKFYFYLLKFIWSNNVFFIESYVIGRENDAENFDNIFDRKNNIFTSFYI
jgi:hypothetical protein